jgi:hypothetical protein
MPRVMKTKGVGLKPFGGELSEPFAAAFLTKFIATQIRISGWLTILAACV